MELYQLRSFLAVAQEGNLTRAAEKLFASQPSVSAHIKALEDESGLRLFERQPSGMKLTAEGERLREHALRILEAADHFRSAAQDLRRAVSGELVLAMNNQPKVLKMTEILARLAREHEALSFRLVYASSGVVLEGIADGTLAAGFFEGTCEHPKIAVDPLGVLELVIAAPKAWAAELRRPDWKLLASKPWVFTTPACSYHRTMERLAREHRWELNKRFGIDEEMTSLEMAADGLALTLTGTHVLEAHPRRDEVVAVPWFREQVPLSLGYLASRAQEPPVAAFRGAVLAVWGKGDEGVPGRGDPPRLDCARRDA